MSATATAQQSNNLIESDALSLYGIYGARCQLGRGGQRRRCLAGEGSSHVKIKSCLSLAIAFAVLVAAGLWAAKALRSMAQAPYSTKMIAYGVVLQTAGHLPIYLHLGHGGQAFGGDIKGSVPVSMPAPLLAKKNEVKGSVETMLKVDASGTVAWVTGQPTTVQRDAKVALLNSDAAFDDTLEGLRSGGFSRLDPLFQDKNRSWPQIVQWVDQGSFRGHDPELAEALTCACFNGRTEVVKYLLSRGIAPQG